MKLIACILACALALASAVQQGQLRGAAGTIGDATPSIPRWGGNNEMFQWSALVNMTAPADSEQFPNWMFNYYYNGAKKVSRYEHGPGNGDEMCGQAKQHIPGTRCTVINALDNKLYITWPGTGNCCIYGDALAIRSDWLQDGGTTYQGETTYLGKPAQEWLKYGAYANHYYCTPDATQAPVAFAEHKGPLLKQWDFVRWSPAAQPDSLFQPPAGQCDATCK